MNLQYKPLGDQGVQIIFGQQISQKICMDIQSVHRMLLQQTELPIYECVPAFTTLSVYYDPRRMSYQKITAELAVLTEQTNQQELYQPYVFEIPTVYGGEFGPDLMDVAAYHALHAEDVIRIHSQRPYLIHMLGFTPGFPYLGGMSEQIATPRLSTPRSKVQAGSVGVAGSQTGIYPVESPGGWRIIGRTPVKLYRPQHIQPFLLEAGHYLKFVPIDESSFFELHEQWSTEQELALKRYPYVESRD